MTGKTQTVLSQIDSKEMGLTLPHEHLFYDMRGASRPEGLHVDREEVVETVLPSLRALKKRGVSTLVECSTGGIGREPLILEALGRKSRIHVVAPTGFYKEPFMPSWIREKTINELADFMREEIETGIEGTPVKAGFIKLAASNEGLTELEEKILRAAARASKKTGAAIAEHTSGQMSGSILLQELKVLREELFDLRKFIWVHAHSEPDISLHMKAAEMGVNIEYDAIGGGKPDDFFVSLIQRMVEKGKQKHVLISQDAGGYNAAEPRGGRPRDMCYIIDHFLPKLEREGTSELIRLIMKENPRRVFELC